MSTTRPTTTRAVHLASRPHGAPKRRNTEELSVPDKALLPLVGAGAWAGLEGLGACLGLKLHRDV